MHYWNGRPTPFWAITSTLNVTRYSEDYFFKCRFLIKSYFIWKVKRHRLECTENCWIDFAAATAGGGVLWVIRTASFAVHQIGYALIQVPKQWTTFVLPVVYLVCMYVCIYTCQLLAVIFNNVMILSVESLANTSISKSSV